LDRFNALKINSLIARAHRVKQAPHGRLAPVLS
jgi:hypothetical protein